MKKAGQLLAVLTAASVLLSGCEKLKDVTTTSVYVSKNGVVTALWKITAKTMITRKTN